MANLPANPGEALWIGGAGGKNHYNIGIGGPGSSTDHTDHSQSEIEDGFTLASYFYLDSNSDVVFKQLVENGHTSANTKYSRTELRELQPNGTSNAAWDGRTGTHYMQGRSKIDHVPSAKPWVCFFQVHDSSSDLARVQTEDGAIICRRTPPGGSEIRTVIASSYTIGAWIDWEMRIVSGTLTVKLNGATVLTAAGMGETGCYFKFGCYNQVSNASDGGGASPGEYCQVTVQRGSAVTWHSGYTTPTTPVFTGSTDPSGGPGGGAGNDTQAPTVPQSLAAVRGNAQAALSWSASTDNVGVTGYNVYRYSTTGSSGGGGSSTTVGQTTGGDATTPSSADKMVASKATCDTAGTLAEGHARAWLSAAGSTTSKMVVYADSSGSPGAKLATSDQITITTTTVDTVQNYVFSGAAQISLTAATDYWIAVTWADPGTPSLTYSRSSLSSQRVESTAAYGTPPTPFGTISGTFSGPIDAWVVAVVGGSTGSGGGSLTSLGKTSDGASATSSSADKTAVSSAVASASGTLTAGHARAWLSATGSAVTKCVVYANSAGAPGTRLATSNPVTITQTAEAVVDYTFTGADAITITSGTTYWVGLAWQDPGTPSLNLSRDGTASGRQEVSSYAPTPFGTPTAQAGPIDVYVETSSGGGAVAGGFVLLTTRTVTNYTNTGLTNGQEYTYAVSAKDAAGNESALSDPVTVIPGAPDTTGPTVPTGLAVTAGDGRLTITWTASTDADSGMYRYTIYSSGVAVGTVAASATTATELVLVGLTNGTMYSIQVSATDRSLNESAKTSAVTATPTAPALSGGATFLPGRLTGGKLEVAIASNADLTANEATWTWTDITADVRNDPGISTSLGRNDESSTSNPADLSLVLDNTSGDYIGVRRNTPVRVRIDPGSGGGRVVLQAFSNGFTPRWMAPGIPVVTLSASGTLRRLAQGSAPVQSAYRRAMTARSSVVSYWPLEDGSGARFGYPVKGGSVFTVETGTADWGSSSDFDCSAPLPTLRTANMYADVTSYATPTAQQVRFLLSIPDNGLPDTTALCRIRTNGTIIQWTINYLTVNGVPCFSLQRFNADDTQNSIDTITFPQLLGTPGRVSLDLTQSGSNILWTLSFTPAAPGSVAVYANGTITGKTAGIVTRVRFNGQGGNLAAAVGHLTVENAITSLFTDVDALAAYFGEVNQGATDGRLGRLCTENGVPLQRYTGRVSDLVAVDYMGPQLVAPLLDLLRECEVSGQGQLWDGRSAGLSYTTRKRRELGTVKLTVDASAGQLAGDFQPVDDDQRDRNKVTVTRLRGASYTYEDTSGAKGTGPTGIGIYDDAVTVNCSTDDSTMDFAKWFVRLGTVEGYRYPSVTVDLAASPTLAAAVLDIVPGERINVTNLDTTLAQFPDATVSLIVEGIAHEITSHTWTATFRCSPFGPWALGITGTPALIDSALIDTSVIE